MWCCTLLTGSHSQVNPENFHTEKFPKNPGNADRWTGLQRCTSVFARNGCYIIQMIQLYTHRFIYRSTLCYCGLLSLGDLSHSDIFLSFSDMDGISLVELKVPKRKKGEEEEQQQQQTKHLRSSAAMSLSNKLKHR